MKANFRPGEELQRQITAPLVRRKIGIALGVLAFLVILFLVREPILGLLRQREFVRDWVQSFGPLAPLAYIALYVLQILVAPIPGNVISLMGGYLFGPVSGVLYSLVGLGLGAGLAATLARRLGRPLIQRFTGEQALQQWERRLRIRSPITWGLIFLFPVPDALYYLAGLSGAPLRWLVLAAMVGRVPSLIVNNWLGAESVNLSFLQLVGVLILVAAVGVVVYRYQRELRLLALTTLRYTRRLARKRIPRGVNMS